MSLYCSYTGPLLGALWRSGQSIQKGFFLIFSMNLKIEIGHFPSCLWGSRDRPGPGPS